MTTVINNPGENKSSGGLGIIIGIILLIIVVAGFIIYVLPRLRNDAPRQNNVDINLTLPEGSNGENNSPSY